MDEKLRQRAFEDRFLAQLRARAMGLVKGKLPADRVQFEPTPEGVDALRAELGRLEVYDRGAIETLPGTQCVEMTFQRKMLGGLFFPTVSRVRVRTLTQTAALVRGQAPGPVGREEVLDALARYTLLPRRSQPTGTIFASPTGFTREAQALVESYGPPTLVLLGGRADGGWDVAMPAALKKTPWANLLELEGADERLSRLMNHLSQDPATLDSRGFSVNDLAVRLGLPEGETRELIRRACRTDPRLMTVEHDGATHVCRAPLGEEGHDPMSLWSRVRRMLGFKPTVAERVRDMTVQRVRIEQERHDVDKKIESLEVLERGSVQQGAAATTDVERKQLAQKLVRVRTELKRLRAQAQNYTNALEVLGTHIHHLTLAEQNKRLELPTAQELTREAAQAETAVAQLSTNADLARSIEVGATTPMMEEEELAILEEFKQAAAQPPVAAPASASKAGSTDRAPAAPIGSARREPMSPPPIPGSERREGAKPELG